MAIGRFLATDSADLIRGFGDTIGDLTSDVLDWQTLVARRADSERQRRIEESREERLRKAADNAERDRDFDVMSELAGMPADRRSLVAGTLSPARRRRFGFADAVPPMSLDVQPPTAAGPGALPSTIETAGAPAFDPFGDLPADESIEYRGSTFPTRDEYLGFRTDEQRAIYEGRPERRLSGPGANGLTESEAMRLLETFGAIGADLTGTKSLEIPASEYGRILRGLTSGEITPEGAAAEVDAARDRAPAEDAGGFFGDEPEEEDDGGSFWDFLPWVGNDDEEAPARGRLSGPGATPSRDQAPPEHSDADIEETRRLIRAALDAGRTPAEIAAVLAPDLQITEAQAMQLIRAAREEE